VSVLDLQYNYNWATQDNGNVLGITNNRDTTRSQTFAYDQVNRVATAETTSDAGASPTNCWGESYGYDQWGNITDLLPISAHFIIRHLNCLPARSWMDRRHCGCGGYLLKAGGNGTDDHPQE